MNGERDGIRTHGRLIKSQMLYQLSYAPVKRGGRNLAKQGRPGNRFPYSWANSIKGRW